VEIGGKMPAYCPLDELSLCKLSKVLIPASAGPLHAAAGLRCRRGRSEAHKHAQSALPAVLLFGRAHLGCSAPRPAGRCRQAEQSAARRRASAQPRRPPCAQAHTVLTPDTVREFLITRTDNRTGEVQLSVKKIETEILWQRLRQLRDHKVYVPAAVVQSSANRSGALVDYFGQTGFVPGSHIPNVRACRAPPPPPPGPLPPGPKRTLRAAQLVVPGARACAAALRLAGRSQPSRLLRAHGRLARHARGGKQGAPVPLCSGVGSGSRVAPQPPDAPALHAPVDSQRQACHPRALPQRRLQDARWGRTCIGAPARCVKTARRAGSL